MAGGNYSSFILKQLHNSSPDIKEGPELYYSSVEDPDRATTMIMTKTQISGTEMSVVEVLLCVVQ